MIWLARIRSILLAVLLLLPGTSPADDVPDLLLMEPEIEGDLLGQSDGVWADRLELLAGTVANALVERGVYDVVDPAAAEASFAKHRRRAGVHSCVPCAIESGTEAGAERTLALRVFRMSALVLSLQAILRDVETGEVRYAQTFDFRGDTDRAWLHAAGFLINALEAIPPELR